MPVRRSRSQLEAALREARRQSWDPHSLRGKKHSRALRATIDRLEQQVRDRTDQVDEAERLAQATIDALVEQICVLDEHGMILAVNKAWHAFAEANPPVRADHYLSLNYLGVCETAQGPCSEEAPLFAAGLRAVLCGEQESFSLEYPCHSPFGERRWFEGRITRFVGDGPTRLVVAHRNVTQRKLAEESLRIKSGHLQALLRLSQALERAQSYEAIVRAAQAEVWAVLGLSELWIDHAADDRTHVSAPAPGEAASVSPLPGPAGSQPGAGSAPEAISAAAEIVVVDGIVHVPLLLGDRKLGTLGIGGFGAAHLPILSDEQREFLLALAGLVSTALDRSFAAIALREQDERYRSLVESLESIIATVDAAGVYHYMNRIAAASLGGTPESLVGKQMRELFPPEMAEQQLKHIRQVIATGVGMVSEDRSMVLGRPRWYRISIQPVRDGAGRISVALINALDITELKESELVLEERVLERTAELAGANRARDEFLANMSHELRTPLNGILALSEALLEQTRGPLNERQLKSLQSIEASGRHLLALINDILDVSKIEAGKLELAPEWLVLNDMCQASLAFVREPAVKKGLSLSFRPNRLVRYLWADGRRLKQILINLLSNAVKFTDSGGQIALEVDADVGREVVDLSVEDNGIGIAPEDLERLFTPFVQVDTSLTRHHEGSGLGLALVSRLTRLHGGSVYVVSKPGKGSRFTVRLPWQPGGQAAAEGPPTSERWGQSALDAAPEAQKQGRQGLVLIAEDSVVNVESVSDYLQFHGFEVVVAGNGQEALALALACPPDLILMDIQMPVMDGLEATRRIRATPALATVPIVALTALAMSGDRERCLQAGANAYLSKPVRLKDLTTLIRQLLAVRRSCETDEHAADC